MKVNHIIKKTLLLVVLGTVSLFPSCKNWLDVSPKTEMKLEELFKDESGFSDVLTGVYAYMAKPVMYGQNLSFAYLDVLAQYYNSPRKTSGTSEHSYNKASFYKYTESSEEDRIRDIWGTTYGRIINLNLGIEFINKSRHVFQNEDIYNVYRGEYYALRAMLHFDILRLFAPSPKMNGGNGLNAKAIPYIELYTKNPQPQLTVAEVLDKVIADLIIAKEALAKSDPYGPKSIFRPKEEDLDDRLKARWTRMNYYAVSSLLARVYLYAGKNDLALAEAKSIIGNPENNPVFFQLAASTATDELPIFLSEMLFSISMIDFDKRMENILIEVSSTTSTSKLSMSKAMQAAFYSVKAQDIDYRMNWLKTNAANDYMLRKYVATNLVTLISLSELYLIAAECATPSEGLKYLNKLYYHRGKTALDSDANLTMEIYKEYRREMIGTGQMFFYYKRNVASSVGVLDDIAISDPDAIYNLPIPKKELEFGNIAK